MARQVEEDKDLGEVWDAVEGLLKAALGSNKMADATAQLPKLVAAAEGIQNAVAAIKSKDAYESAGAFAGRIAKTIVEAVQDESDPPAAA